MVDSNTEKKERKSFNRDEAKSYIIFVSLTLVASLIPITYHCEVIVTSHLSTFCLFYYLQNAVVPTEVASLCLSLFQMETGAFRPAALPGVREASELE